MVLDGESHLDESIATGESVPVYKTAGDSVIGATINKEGRLRVKVTKVGGDTFLSQVIKLVEQAQGSRVPIQEFADRMTGRFVPVVLFISLGSLIVWLLAADSLRPMLEWGAGFLPWVDPSASTTVLAILSAIAVLVIACPCALGLATPTALMVGSGIGAERGILIRSGEAIQTFKDIKVMVLDKTGTITRGEPKLTELATAEGVTEQQLLQWAATVENASEHPIARAIVEGARERNVTPGEVTEFRSTGARGVSGKVAGAFVLIGNRKLLDEEGVTGLQALDQALDELEGRGRTAVLVAVDGKACGVVAVADTIKMESVAAIRGMHELGLHVHERLLGHALHHDRQPDHLTCVVEGREPRELHQADERIDGRAASLHGLLQLRVTPHATVDELRGLLRDLAHHIERSPHGCHDGSGRRRAGGGHDGPRTEGRLHRIISTIAGAGARPSTANHVSPHTIGIARRMTLTTVNSRPAHLADCEAPSPPRRHRWLRSRPFSSMPSVPTTASAS